MRYNGPIVFMSSIVLLTLGSHNSLQQMEAKLIKLIPEKHLNRKRVSRGWKIFIYNLWDNITLWNDNDLKSS